MRDDKKGGVVEKHGGIKAQEKNFQGYSWRGNETRIEQHKAEKGTEGKKI